MANLTHGMNIDQVETLGLSLKDRAGDIDRLITDIDTKLRATTWAGPDADRFRHEWWPKHKARLRATSNEIAGLGQSALNNASEQRSVSDDRTGSAGRGTPGGSRPRSSASESVSNQEFAVDILKQIQTIKDIADLRATDLQKIVELRKAGKLTSVSLKGAGVSIGLGALDYYIQGREHGWSSHDAIWAALDGTAGTAAGIAVPGGGVAWWLGTQIGTGVGTVGLAAGDAVTEWTTGSSAGSQNTSWLMRHYNVARIDQLPGEIQVRAASEMTESRMGAKGVYNLFIGDSVEQSWWVMSNPKRAWTTMNTARGSR